MVAAGAADVAVAVGPFAGASDPAPTKIGVATESPGGFVSTAGLYVQAIDPNPSIFPGASSYAIPAAGGVITHWSLQVVGSSSTPGIALNVVHQGASSGTGVYTDTVDATDVETVPSVGPAEVVTYPARLPVTAGDRIGLFLPNSSVTVETSPANAGDPGQLVVGPSSQPAVGATFTTALQAAHTHIELSADLEPDADHDFFGDLTQDKCPLDPVKQATPCAADLAADAAATPASVGAGSLALIVAHAPVVSGQATNARLVVTVPAGLTVVSAGGTGGECAGTATLTCPLGDLGPAATGVALVVVQTAAAGSFPFPVAAAADGADANAANNGAAATLTVSSAPAAPTVIKQCTVPPLKGLSETKAKSLLKTFGCASGKVTKRKIKAKHGHKKPKRVVISFSPKLGTRAALGTKVKLTLGAGKR